MGLRNRVKNVGRNIIGATGVALTGFAEDEALWKAKKPTDDDDNSSDDEGGGDGGGEDEDFTGGGGKDRGGNAGSGMADEGQERTPGGAQVDTVANAPVPTQKAEDDPKTLFWDPFAIIEQLGFKEKPTSVTYGTLNAMVWKTPIVQAVINTRLDQVAAFCKPSHDRFDMGFKFHRRNEPRAELTDGERKWASQMNGMMMRTGITDNPRGRDNFETFTRKFMRDSLVYDQGCFETVKNRLGQPAEWYAVDGATIRQADSASANVDEDDASAVRYVQIYDGMVITEYTQEELCFAVRNPRTDIRLFGYGTAELEMLVNTVTSLLWAWEYNQNAFSQGSVHKGVLNFKGAVPDKQLKAFRRHWYQMLSGVQNAWRTPITNADDLQWIDMHQNSRDMEYNAWFDFLIKVTCAIFRMDPIEVNFQYGNVGQKSALSESSNTDKITSSKERGLRPLLTWYADILNRHIVWPINEGMELGFAGLDSMTREEVADLNAKRVKTTTTIDELRAEDGDAPLPDGQGAVILDPAWMAARNQEKQMEAGAGQFGDEEGGDNPFGGGDDDEDEDDDDKGSNDFRKKIAAMEEDEASDAEESEKSMAPRRDSGKKSMNVDVTV